jgi:hypothetical protein
MGPAICPPVPPLSPGHVLCGAVALHSPVGIGSQACWARTHSLQGWRFSAARRNVLLSREGNAKIGDVGFSRIMNREYISNTNNCLGTFDVSAAVVPSLLA